MITIEQLQLEVSDRLFESDFKLYEESIDLILKFFKHNKTSSSEELVDLMQEVLDNKITTYVKGEFTANQKDEILEFVTYQWNVSLAKMKIAGKEEIRVDSMVSQLLEILTLSGSPRDEIKRLLEKFFQNETNKKYSEWIQRKLRDL